MSLYAEVEGQRLGVRAIPSPFIKIYEKIYERGRDSPYPPASFHSYQLVRKDFLDERRRPSEFCTAAMRIYTQTTQASAIRRATLYDTKPHAADEVLLHCVK